MGFGGDDDGGGGCANVNACMCLWMRNKNELKNLQAIFPTRVVTHQKNHVIGQTIDDKYKNSVKETGIAATTKKHA